MKKIFRFLLFMFSIFIFMLGCIFNNLNVILISICSIWLNNIIYSIEKFNKRIVFFAFNITFFTFLIGRLVVKSLTNYYDAYNFNKYGLDFYDFNIEKNTFICLFISLLFLFLGFYIIEKKNKFNIKRKNNFSDYDINLIGKISRNLFYFTYIFNILILLEKAKFTNNVGYTELYSSYSSSYPIFVVKLAQMNAILLFIYLATKPTKRKCYVPISLYTISGVISLFVGQRNNFVLNIMIILIYFCFRNLDSNNKKWLGKKHALILIISLPLILGTLNMVANFRVDSKVEDRNNKIISKFLYDQGVSVNLIGYAQVFDNQLSSKKVYTFGRLISFFNDNVITKIIFNTKTYDAQSVESALYGNSFADSISYIISPNRYINGWGYGSCYVAELIKDFGFSGVMVGNFIIGIILFYMRSFFESGIFRGAFALAMIRLLLYMPRDTTLSFVVSSFNIINILATILVFAIFIVLEKNIIVKE
ncbi:O-antigen polysaccharide polymerase Wzy [Clostridium perfringens]|uniref:O-antigen polysaccharide polymerase Wzy n=1 Tax=Clostridium perfringens TaxID=1502 RepID=UPI0018E4B447|nr:O-antigen polysaccharide polymerase Wzy family protein [Clostridium perfringens]